MSNNVRQFGLRQAGFGYGSDPGQLYGDPNDPLTYHLENGHTVYLPLEWFSMSPAQRFAWIQSSPLSAQDATALEAEAGLDIYAQGQAGANASGHLGTGTTLPGNNQDTPARWLVALTDLLTVNPVYALGDVPGIAPSDGRNTFDHAVDGVTTFGKDAAAAAAKSLSISTLVAIGLAVVAVVVVAKK